MKTMKTMSILLAMFCVYTSCSAQAPQKPTTAADVLQTAGVQITAFINMEESTISVLYGDSAAFESAHQYFKRHTAEEHFVLITYKLKDFYYDYDAQARGGLERVEYISGIDPKDNNKFSYRMTFGQMPMDKKGARFNEKDRVKFIFSHQPYQYPSVQDLNR